jgi:hypothetical protein
MREIALMSIPDPLTLEIVNDLSPEHGNQWWKYPYEQMPHAPLVIRLSHFQNGEKPTPPG